MEERVKKPGLCGKGLSNSCEWITAYFRLSPLQKHVRKVVGGFGKKSCVSTGVRKPGNMCVTDRHDMTLAVKVALNSNTTNQLSSGAIQAFLGL